MVQRVHVEPGSAALAASAGRTRMTKRLESAASGWPRREAAVRGGQMQQRGSESDGSMRHRHCAGFGGGVVCVVGAVYAVYAVSSLDTGVSLRPRPKARPSGRTRELPGSLPGPSRWEKRPGRICGRRRRRRRRRSPPSVVAVGPRRVPSVPCSPARGVRLVWLPAARSVGQRRTHRRGRFPRTAPHSPRRAARARTRTRLRRARVEAARAPVARPAPP